MAKCAKYDPRRGAWSIFPRMAGERLRGDGADGAPWVPVGSRRPAVLRRLHAIDARRLQEIRSWVVSFAILRPFRPSRETTTLHAIEQDIVASMAWALDATEQAQ